jgi:hypothetical protein
VKTDIKFAAAIVGCLTVATPTFGQASTKLAVGPDAGGYLCPDGQQLYVESCYNEFAAANCGVILMHLPLQRGYQQQRTQTRAEVTASVAACKVYPVEFRNPGTVHLVLPKSPPPQQTAKAPSATPTPKAAANPGGARLSTAPTHPLTNSPPQAQAPARRWGRVDYRGEYISRIGDMKVEYRGEYIHRIGDMRVEYLGEYISRIGDMKVEYRGEYISRIGDMKVEYRGEYIYRVGD